MPLMLYFSLSSADYWKFVEMICEKLKIFYDMTLLISRRYFPTANWPFRLICKIKLNLQSWLRSNVDIIVDMASRMIDKFDKNGSEMNGLLSIALILDLRNKLDCVDFYFKDIYRSEASKEIQRITSLLCDLLVEYVDRKVKVSIVEDPLLLLQPPLVTLLFLKMGLLKKIAMTNMFHIRKPRKGRST